MLLLDWCIGFLSQSVLPLSCRYLCVGFWHNMVAAPGQASIVVLLEPFCGRTRSKVAGAFFVCGRVFQRFAEANVACSQRFVGWPVTKRQDVGKKMADVC